MAITMRPWGVFQAGGYKAKRGKRKEWLPFHGPPAPREESVTRRSAIEASLGIQREEDESEKEKNGKQNETGKERPPGDPDGPV
jgi:hypothetical protein